MPDIQIKEYAITPLADTDSLVKQAIGGLTARTTVADLKSNLDGRYAQKGTVIWEDNDGSSYIILDAALYSTHIYEVHINISGATGAPGRMVLRGKPGTEPWLTGVSHSGVEFYIFGLGTIEANPIQLVGGVDLLIYKIIDLGESL